MERSRGPNSIIQRKFIDDCGSDKVSDCLPVGMVITTNMATASIEVGDASSLRVILGGAAFIAFSDDKAALDVATIDGTYVASPCIQLTAAGSYLLACPAKFARSSLNPTRVELNKN